MEQRHEMLKRMRLTRKETQKEVCLHREENYNELMIES